MQLSNYQNAFLLPQNCQRCCRNWKMKCQIMFGRLQLNVTEMHMVPNWSIHNTDWKNYVKLILTRARNTGSPSQAVLFPFLKELRAEIIFPCIFGKDKGSVSVTLHSLQGSEWQYCQLLPHGGAEPGAGCLTLWGQCRESTENELRKGRITWRDGKYIPLLKHRAACCFLKIPSIISCYQCGIGR